MFKSKNKEKNSFEILTRANTSTLGKPKVFLACHQDDKSLALEIADDILKYVDVAIYYPAHSMVTEEEIEMVMSLSTLLVMPITNKLLDEKKLINTCAKFAGKQNMAVLPVLFEKNVDDRFNQLSGNLHLCVKGDSLDFGKSYDDRIKDFLTDLFISDELAQKVRDSFDSYIFLSYRKKDKTQARELMRDIHEDKVLQNVAIWYDEFLSPGENFNDEIESALKKSDIFTLLVTPNLLEPSNYVLSTEYPMAQKEQKEIVPIEKTKTARHALEKKYKNLPSLIDGANISLLQNVLKEKLKSLAISISDSPEHNYYVGLAYLAGIDIEVNKQKGIEILKGSALAGFIPAMERLVSIYMVGDGVNIRLGEALKYATMLVDCYRKLVSSDYSYQTCLANWLIKAGYLYTCLREYEEGEKLSKEALEIYENIKVKDDEYYHDMFKALDSYGDQLILQDKHQQAQAIYECLGDKISKYNFTDKFDEMFKSGQVYYKLTNIYVKFKEYDKAKDCLLKALDIFRKLYAYDKRKYAYFLACILDALANISGLTDNKDVFVFRKEAKELFFEAMKSGLDIVKDDYYDCLLLLCDEYSEFGNGDYREEINCWKEAYPILKERTFSGKEDSLIYFARINLKIGHLYLKIDDAKTAGEYFSIGYDLIKQEMQKSQTPYFHDIAVAVLGLTRVHYLSYDLKNLVYDIDTLIDTICNYCEDKDDNYISMLSEAVEIALELISEEERLDFDFTKRLEDVLKFYKDNKSMSLLTDIMRISHALSVLYASKGDFNKQISVLMAAIDFSNSFSGKKEQEYLDDSLILFSLGMAYYDLRSDKQEEYFLKLIDGYEKHFEGNITEEVYEIATITVDKLVEFYSSKGDLLKQKLIEQRVERLLNSNK